MKSLYETAIKFFGETNQVNVAIEECSELIKALCKLRRGGDLSSVFEEIADVEIMLEQLKIIFDCEDEVAYHRNIKLGRLEKRIEKEIGK